MKSIPLGRVTVATAGTPVPLASVITQAQQAMLSAAGLCAKVEVWPDPTSSGKVFVKDAKTGNVMAALPVPTGGYPVPWSTPEIDHNGLRPTDFALDAATSGDGAFITLWVA
jgi:hypothetical protein